MASIRETITARVAAAIAAAPTGAMGVFRSREATITRGVTPAVVVLPASESAVPFAVGTDRCTYEIQVDVLTRGDPWDALADPVATAVHAAITQDAQLRALVHEIRLVATDYSADEADRTAGVLANVYRITYFRSSTDLSR